VLRKVLLQKENESESRDISKALAPQSEG
jgi:hypothetical protein